MVLLVDCVTNFDISGKELLWGGGGGGGNHNGQ